MMSLHFNSRAVLLALLVLIIPSFVSPWILPTSAITRTRYENCHSKRISLKTSTTILKASKDASSESNDSSNSEDDEESRRMAMVRSLQTSF